MNIERFLNPKSMTSAEKNLYVGASKRSAAAMIDVTIALMIRVFVAQVIGSIFVNPALQKFLIEFRDKFGTEFVKNNPAHIDFVLHNRIFFILLFFYSFIVFIGAIYHSTLNSSAWQATVGKRVMGFAIEKEDGKPLSFNIALTHYFLSLLPFVYIFYIIVYQLMHNITFFTAVTSSWLNIFLGVLFLLWAQIQNFTVKKTTAYDLICRTVLINKKTSAKFPWSKNKISNFL